MPVYKEETPCKPYLSDSHIHHNWGVHKSEKMKEFHDSKVRRDVKFKVLVSGGCGNHLT